MKAKICELCSEEAALFCDSDHAFLCWSCDAKVHSANFLVARHLRRPLCSLCESLAGASVSGVGFSAGLRSPICRSCSPVEIAEEEENHSGSDSDSDSDSDSSDCVSSNKESNLQAPIRVISPETKRGNDQNRHRALVRVLKSWCARLGLHGNSAKTVVSLASHALGLCVGRTRRAALPVKLTLAASFWYGLWCFGGKVSARDARVVRRIEEITGVSVQLIVTVGLKIGREFAAKKNRRSDLEEGWAETETETESCSE